MTEQLTKKAVAQSQQLFVGLWEMVFEKIDELSKFCQEVSKTNTIPITYPFPPLTSPDKTIKCSMPQSKIDEINDIFSLIAYLAEVVNPQTEIEVNTSSMVT